MIEDRTCPLCTQIVPKNVPQFYVFEKYIHETCAKILVEKYINKHYKVAPKSDKRGKQ